MKNNITVAMTFVLLGWLISCGSPTVNNQGEASIQVKMDSDGSITNQKLAESKYVKITLINQETGQEIKEKKPYSSDLTLSFDKIKAGNWEADVALIIEGVSELGASSQFAIEKGQILVMTIHLSAFVGGFGNIALEIEVLDDNTKWVAKDVSPSNFNTCVLTDKDKVFCFGRDFDSYPVQVAGFQGGLKSIHGGRDLTVAVNKNGGAEFFKHNESTHPEKVEGLNVSLKQVTVGGQVTCGVDLDGRLFCWTGDLNITFNENLYDALLVEGISEPIKELYTTSCNWTPGQCNGVDALLDNGDLVSIDLTPQYAPSGPTTPIGMNGSVQPVAGFSDLTAATSNINGFCGVNDDSDQYKVSCSGGLNEEIVVNKQDAPDGVSLGSYHTLNCLLNNNTTQVSCWGVAGGSADSEGVAYNYGNKPVTITGIKKPLSKIAVGARHACGVTEKGHLYCWGRNDLGQLGVGAADDFHTTAVQVN